MINIKDVLETVNMIREEHLDVRTITMGISLLDCAAGSAEATCENIYKKITDYAKNLVKTGEDIEKEYGIPIIHKRISVTPISQVGGLITKEDYILAAKTLDKAGKAVGVNFIGGFSALVQKGMTKKDIAFLDAVPEALAATDIVCSSVNVGSTRCGIDMDAVNKCGAIIKRLAFLTKEDCSIGCAKFVVFANAPEDNPFMAGAFHGVGEPECEINVGVSGPGVVRSAVERARRMLVLGACGCHQKDGVQGHAYGSDGGLSCLRAAGRSVWHCRPVAWRRRRLSAIR